MDPVLSSLFPVNQIGSDGFNWWVGQVESNKNDDPKNSGRYRVRIVGQHLKDCDATPTEELPWANVMMPVTTPFTDGGVTGATVDLRQGNWVIGFYMDADKQKPIIMGSIGHTAGATLLKNVEKDPNPGKSCKSFTTYFDPSANPYTHFPLKEKDKVGGDPKKDNTEYTKVGQAGLIANAVPEKQSAAFYGLFAENTSTNPTGGKICVEIANPKCGSESDLKGGLTNILGEMLAANQQSSGQLGTYYISKVNGELSNYIDHGRKYVHKAVRLVKSFLARVKGEIVRLIREGVNKLVDLALIADVPDKDELGNVNTGPVNPDLGIKPFKPITKKQSRLKPVIDTVNNVLNDLGCSMEDITDKIAQWLTDLLFNFLMDAFNAAACLVDTLVNGVLNEILALLEDLISTVLGPLQSLLSVLANPLNLISSAINKVLSLLGISCDGPGSQCEKVTKECVDCGTEDKEDWLDKLISEIESGPSAGLSICRDARKYPTPKFTNITFVGGIFQASSELIEEDGDSVIPLTESISYTSADIIVKEGEDAEFIITRTGNTSVSSSIRYETISDSAVEDEDFLAPTTGGTLGFAPGEFEKRITYRTFNDGIREQPERFFIRVSPAVTPVGITPVFPNGDTFQCQILDYTPDSIQLPLSFTSNPVRALSISSSPLPPAIKYDVESDRSFYYEGETITYTITTQNVPTDTELSYTLSGDIDEDDIDGGQLTGKFLIIDNQAEVKIKLAVNNDNDSVVDGEDIEDFDERITFSIDDTPAFTTVTIIGENNLDPYYSVEADSPVVEEGDTITFTINTFNVLNNTILSYTLTGDVNQSDIVGGNLTGQFEIIDGKAEVKIEIAEDEEFESSELLVFTIDNTDASASVIISADLGEGGAAEEDLEPTFFVESDKLEYTKGETAVFTITTTNVPDATPLNYSLLGNKITENDIVGGKLTGDFVVINNTAIVYVGINTNLTFESNQTLTFVIDGTGASSQVVILSERLEERFIVPKISDPCISPPLAGEPITDENGSIISIPILNNGCPYVEPPRVIITGSGYGSSAIALLGGDGRVAEIRVTRTGRGYVKNTSDNVGVVCVIDSYTLLNPGRDYTSEPDVYVNGELGIARAKINEDGFVYSVEVVDRTKTFKEIPTILIQGGGGSGARVLPSLNCIDNAELERRGYVKIGTGKYIDCP
jgi:hypothetical protein